MNLARVLDFINEIRKEQGRRPLRKIPKGVPGDPLSCPIATGINHAFKAEVDGYSAIYRDAEEKRKTRHLPGMAAHFVTLFDANLLPELVDKKRTEIFNLKHKRSELTRNLKYFRGNGRYVAGSDERISEAKAQLTEVNKKLKKLEKK